MTITATVPYVVAAGNGAQVAFDTVFKIFEKAAIKVTLKNVATDVETPQTLTTHYDITFVGNSTSRVTFVTAPPTGYNVVIWLDPAITQPTDLKNGGPYDPVVVENSLDRRNMIEQAVRFLVDKCIKAPDGEVPAAADMLLPSIMNRKNKALIFDSAGKVTAGAIASEPVSTGTFTPTLRGSTGVGTPSYVAQAGFYTKVGRLVFVSGFVQISAKTGITGFAQIGGLPFAASLLDAAMLTPFALSSSSGITITGGGAIQLMLEMQPGASVILFKGLVSGGSHTTINITDFNNASRIAFSGCYMTD